MSDSNRTILIRGVEGRGGTNWGTSPAGSASPSNYRTLCTTGNTLNKNVTYTQDDCVRSDRMTDFSLETGQTIEGDINFNLSFFTFDEELEGLFMDAWDRTGLDIDTAITAIDGTTNDSFTVDDAAAEGYAVGHLIRSTGMADTLNNGVWTIDTISTNELQTSDGAALVDETPGAGARLKVVGFAGVLSDIGADAAGLTSATIDFTTLGLTVGQWIKIGGALAAEKFVADANNDFARISAIAANVLTLDEKPSGWTVEALSGSIAHKVWIADTLKNGVTRKSFSYERAFDDQLGNKYQQYVGCEIATGSLNFPVDGTITGTFGYMGKDAAFAATSLEPGTPLPTLNQQPMTTTSNLGSVQEGGTTITGPNWIQSMDLSFANNLRDIRAVGSQSSVSIGVGSLDNTGTITLYYGDSTMLEKYQSGTETSVSFRTNLNNQAYVFSMPRIKFESGSSDITGKDVDVTTPLGYRALRDPVFNAHILLSSFEYYQ